MDKTILLEVTTHCHVFQPGALLELKDEPADGISLGYAVPDTGDGSTGIIPAKSVRKVSSEPDNVHEYRGHCLLTKVSNFYKDNAGQESAGQELFGVVKPEQVRVIHYPDCQQIVFHMPKYAYDAGTFQIIDLVRDEIIVNTAVKDRLNGSTMILLDSLPLKPGFYCMEADWPGGWTHQIRFIKFAEGFPNASYENPPVNVRQAIKGQEVHLLNLPVPEPVKPNSVRLGMPPPTPNYEHPPGNISVIQNDHEYRLFDSNGVEIDNGPDLQQFRADLAAKFGPVLEYTQEGRGGNIYYREKEISIKLDWEFAAGRGVIDIFFPSEAYWESTTKLPLSRRDEVLAYVCRKVIEDQAPGCAFEIYPDWISIVRK
jgi:hypothetical protein